MLLVDMGSVFGKCVGMYSKSKGLPEEACLPAMRTVTISTLLSLRKAFVKGYGNIVMCFDTKPYWRTEVFDLYKENRKLAKNDVNDKLLSEHKNIVIQELFEYTPFVGMVVADCEADDIIFVLSKLVSGKEKIMICSSDKDMIQMHQKCDGVRQYSVGQEKFIEDDGYSLLEHIIKGDRSDGIPNIFSPSDILMHPGEGLRQKVISKKILASAMECKNILEWDMLDEKSTAKFRRNFKLISSDGIPKEITSWILTEYDDQLETPNKSRIREYLISRRIKRLL